MGRLPTSAHLARASAWLAIVALGGCVDPYLPEVVSANANYLVVDGFINGNGRTRIRLSRSENVAATTAPPVQKGATIYIVDDAGQRYAVPETSVAGVYRSDSLLLNPVRRYQLRISLGAASYASDLMPLKVTPDFDQLALVRQDGQYQLTLGTHDARGQSRYYRWNYTETWEFNSAYNSVIELKKGVIRPRTTPIYTCWHTEQPTFIRQASTVSLSQDVIANYVLNSFSDRSERLKIRYSVLVTQYAESAEEFAYNEVLRKNTEAVGTVNDPLPSQLTGNVHRLDNPQEPVLGFVGAHTLTVRRLFATAASLGLPQGWQFEDPYAKCIEIEELVPDPEDKFPNVLHIPQTRVFNGPDYVPTRYKGVLGADTIGYYGSTRECVDCRVRGSNMKPAFW
jgi:hypothetical protein